MRVLVTGGSGAIGSFVVGELCDRGHEVTVFDVVEPDRSDRSEVTFVKGDVTDADAVTGAVGPADTVVHLAALLPDACQEDPERANAVNVGGTLNVFEAAGRDTRVIYASSKGVFGATGGAHGHPTYEPTSEDAPKAPTGVYGVTKQACEQYATAYRSRGLDAAAVRFASTYGPGKGEAHGDLAYVPDLIRRAHAGETIHVEGGDQRNDFGYYRDLARGVAAAVETDELSYPAYHIGTGEAIPVRAFAEALRERTDAEVTVEGGLNYRGADRPSYMVLDISRARDDLGYEPAYLPEAAVEDYLAFLDGEA